MNVLGILALVMIIVASSSSLFGVTDSSTLQTMLAGVVFALLSIAEGKKP